MYRMRPHKKDIQCKLHCTQRDRWAVRRCRSANLCIPIIYPSVDSKCASPMLTSPPIRASNSAGATPVRGAECGAKCRPNYSPELPRSPSANSAEFHGNGNSSGTSPALFPPGPPASPVPSPPGEMSTAPPTPSSDAIVPAASVIRVKLRKRRNAICSQTPMGRGLREFLVSYIVSHLTDSMTSSLNLTATAHTVMEADDDKEEEPAQLTDPNM
uniref:Uncharacterized protein n=1 Tax=Mesocestoides corti TaxID=53468 RepID=A0A5K3F982_MESCO